MKYSVVLNNDAVYRITITANSDEEKKFLEGPIREIQNRVYQYFDQAVKENLGEKASILVVKDDSGLPYEISALIKYND